LVIYTWWSSWSWTGCVRVRVRWKNIRVLIILEVLFSFIVLAIVFNIKKTVLILSFFRDTIIIQIINKNTEIEIEMGKYRFFLLFLNKNTVDTFVFKILYWVRVSVKKKHNDSKSKKWNRERGE
jgi:hypothetical protein